MNVLSLSCPQYNLPSEQTWWPCIQPMWEVYGQTEHQWSTKKGRGLYNETYHNLVLTIWKITCFEDRLQVLSIQYCYQLMVIQYWCSLAGNNWWLPTCEQRWWAAVFILQQQEWVVGVTAGKGLHEGHGWLWLPWFELCECSLAMCRIM